MNSTRWDKRAIALLASVVLALSALLAGPGPARAEQRLAVGDSILLAAQGNFEQLGYRVDARYGRPFDEGLAIIRSQAATLPPVVFVHLGTNSPVTAAQCEELVSLVGPARSLTLATVRIPSYPSIAAENNRVLAACAAAHKNVQLLDWAGYVAENPDVVCPDGIHISCGGEERYTAFIHEGVMGASVSIPAPSPVPAEESAPPTGSPVKQSPAAAASVSSTSGSGGTVVGRTTPATQGQGSAATAAAVQAALAAEENRRQRLRDHGLPEARRVEALIADRPAPPAWPFGATPL